MLSKHSANRAAAPAVKYLSMGKYTDMKEIKPQDPLGIKKEAHRVRRLKRDAKD